MPVNVQICRIKREARLPPCHVEQSAIPSLISLSETDPRAKDVSDFTDLSKRKCIPRRLSSPGFSMDHFMACTERPTSSSANLAVARDSTDELQSLDNPPIIVSFHGKDEMFAPNSPGLVALSAEESKCSEVTRRTPFKLEQATASDECCSVTSLPEQKLAENKLYQVVYCQAMQSVELNQGDPGFVKEQDTSSISSFSMSSHSPSPVRSQVVSPFAAGTMAPHAIKSDRIDYPVYPSPLFINQRRTGALKSNIRNHNHSDFQQTGFPVGDARRLGPQPSESYPLHLNPFGPDELEPCPKTDHPISLFKRDASPTVKVPHSPFRNFPTGTCARQSREPSFDFEVIGHGSPTRISRVRKKQAPRPPATPSVYESNSCTSDCLRNGPQIDFNGSYSASVCPIPGVSPAVTKRSPSFRSSSVGLRADSEVGTETNQTAETKSMIVKRPAPPFPVYSKRTVKSDSADSFVSYEELHELLYSTNKRITQLESEARRIQNEIKRASRKNISATGLLDKWAKVVEQRDSMSMKHTQLLERLRRQELDERHANLEHEFRLLWAKQNALKTSEEKEREKQLLIALLDTVNQRAELTDRREEDGDEITESSSTLKNGVSRNLCLTVLKHMRKLKNGLSRSQSRHSFK